MTASSLCEYRGHTVGFCNPGCRDDFVAHVADRPDDRRWFDALIAEREAAAQALAPQPTLETERLRLRPHSEDDADALFAMYADPEVAQYTSRPPMTNRAEAVAALRRVMVHRDDSAVQWAITRRDDDTCVGTIVLFKISREHRRAEIGFSLSRPVWGEGLAREAAVAVMRYGEEQLGLHRFEADADPVNIASLNTLTALGFRREGYARARWRVGGGVQDSVLLARNGELAGPGQGVVDLADKLASFRDAWNPRIVGELNGQHVKLAKLEGAFEWHAHAEEDELFLVLQGRLRMRFRDGETLVEAGQLLIVPRGVEHLPVADNVCHVLLFEPASTVNTGANDSERTRKDLERI